MLEFRSQWIPRTTGIFYRGRPPRLRHTVLKTNAGSEFLQVTSTLEGSPRAAHPNMEGRG